MLRGILIAALSLLTLLTACPEPGANEGEGDVSEGEGDVVAEGEGDVGEGEGDVGEGEGDDGVVGLPHCVAAIVRINGEAVTGTPIVKAFDDVVLYSGSSSSSSPSGEIVSVVWSRLEFPAGFESIGALEATDGREVHLLDLNGPGDFVYGLTVVDDLGAEASCSVAFTVLPAPEGIHVQLTWSTAVDVDLHLAHPGTDWCSNDDLYFAGASRTWGGAATLTVDDFGFGPENANVEAPEDGSYTIGVGVHDAVAGETTATVKVFSGGQLEFEQFHVLSGGQQWLPARIDVADGIVTVVTLDDSSAQPGGCWSN